MSREATRSPRTLSSLLLLLSTFLSFGPGTGWGTELAFARSAQRPAGAVRQDCWQDPAILFQKGQAALGQNQLAAAERDFRAVLICDPGSAAAHVNLGVIEMRRKRWPQALSELAKARALAPHMAGIALNVALVHFQQSDYRSAIPALQSVMAT